MKIKNIEKRRKGGKRALSPVVTTVLLILLAIILALIIFLWWKTLLKDQIAKFNPERGEEGPIEEACSALSLEVSVSGESIIISNNGDIPVYKIGIRADGMRGDNIQIDLVSGATKTVTSTITISEKQVDIIPILLGKSKKTGQNQEFPCPSKDWIQPE